MAKIKKPSKRQLAVIEDLFAGELDTQQVLEKHKLRRQLYDKWQRDEMFIEQFEARIAAAHRQSAAFIARYAPLAAAKLVALTESDKPETARKACLDIISFPSQSTEKPPTPAGPKSTSENNSDRLSEKTASRILSALARENHKK
jgi:hypothetical protein